MNAHQLAASIRQGVEPLVNQMTSRAMLAGVTEASIARITEHYLADLDEVTAVYVSSINQTIKHLHG